MKNKPWLKYLPLIGGGLLVLIVAIIVYVFRDAFEKPAQSKKQVQQVSVVRPPPPPPPPPPKPEIKPPEVKEEEKIPEPEMRPISSGPARSGIRALVKIVANSIPINPMPNHAIAQTRSG